MGMRLRGRPRSWNLAVPLAAAFLLSGCSMGVLDPHGSIAVQQRQILINALVIMLAVAIPTILAGVWFAWWFRSTNPRAKYRPDFVYSGGIEIVMWSVPALLTLFLGGLIWTGTHRLDPYRPIESDKPTIDVQVVALDWKWLFIYPQQGVASVNELVVPAGAPLHFSMTSASVLNTFHIPQLGGMVYVMNGMVTQINLMADHPGQFYGRSAMISGDGFSDMHFNTRAVPPAEFSQWVASTRGKGPVLDRASYTELMKQSIVDKSFTYGSVDPVLFAKVATQEIPPGPGPATGRGGDPAIEEKPAGPSMQHTHAEKEN